jgi:protein-L-isoaspartate(D-aspartate) O-methyltransferase
MIQCQVRTNKVTDPALIETLRSVPRERFVPGSLEGIAYVDEDIAIGNGRYLSEPMVLARLIQAAQVGKGDVVLDIGCGTGYSTAVLGHLAATVVGIEQDKGMVQQADRLLHDLDICNTAIVQRADLREGYAQQGPYNV